MLCSRKLSRRMLLVASMHCAFIAAISICAGEPTAHAFAKTYQTNEGKTVSQLYDKGQAAYNSKDYTQYLELNLQVLASKPGSDQALNEISWYLGSAQYNSACGYALIGDKDKALAMLERVLVIGQVDLNNLEKDTDFTAIQNDKRFVDLCARARNMSGEKRTLVGTVMDIRQFVTLTDPIYAFYLKVDAKDNVVPFQVLLTSGDSKDAGANHDAWIKKMEQYSKAKTPIRVLGVSPFTNGYLSMKVEEIQPANGH